LKPPGRQSTLCHKSAFALPHRHPNPPPQTSPPPAAAAQATLALRKPWPTGPSITPIRLSDAAATRLDTDYGVELRLNAGRTPLVAQLTVRATDRATGLLTAALGHATAEADWIVDRP